MNNLKVLYLDFDDGCSAIEPISNYIHRRFYKHGQGVVMGSIGYSVINEFIYNDIYHVLLTRKLNGDMATRIQNQTNRNFYL